MQALSLIKKNQWTRWDFAKSNLATTKLLKLYVLYVHFKVYPVPPPLVNSTISPTSGNNWDKKTIPNPHARNMDKMTGKIAHETAEREKYIGDSLYPEGQMGYQSSGW